MAGADKKRLGQYFSGQAVADLLVSLCHLSPQDSVIDPMAGIGDMLLAAIRAGASPERAVGVEIDPKAAGEAQASLPSSRIVAADAFRPSTWSGLGGPWDLVVTNPPYVRYQSLGAKEGGGADARQGVARIIEDSRHLEGEEATILLRAAAAYSGLADLAVPSWLLCAALVRKGGTLAMVVPEAWLARDYAWAVKYALLRLFDILYVVEDSGAAWFPEAQVKTNLVVARRTAVVRGRPQDRDDFYKLIRLSPKLIGPKSLAAGLSFGGLKGPAAFNRLAADSGPAAGDGFELRAARMGDLMGSITPKLARWLSKVEPGRGAAISASIPLELKAALKAPVKGAALGRLADWGIQVGQGLRTGANPFFYAELVEDRGDSVVLLSSEAMGGGIIEAPKAIALPALKSQADLGGGYAVEAQRLGRRLILIGEGFRPEEAPASLAKYLERAGTQAIEIGGRMAQLPQLAAVRTNVRASLSGAEGGRRKWYMLPPLARRHLPRLCIPRVNHQSPRCFLVAPGIVVDANFSTFWLDNDDEPLAHAALALMNSVLVRASLELAAAVMGGGALKVEAAHLAAMSLPLPSMELKSSLAGLGRKLAALAIGDEAERELDEVDRLVVGAVLNSSDPAKGLDGLRELLRARLSFRSRQRP